MAKGKIVKNYIYNTSYQIILVIAPLITSPYIARVLGVTGVGVVNYAYSIVTYFVLFGTMGSSLYGQREIAYYQDNPKKRTSILIEIMMFRALTIAISIMVYCLNVVQKGRYPAVYLLMLPELVAMAFDVSWFFQGMEDFKKTVIRNLLVKIAGIALIFILVKSPEDISKYAICLTLPTLIGNISLWIYLPKYVVKVSVSFRSVIKHIKPILVLFIPQIAMEVYTVLDKTMIGSMATNIDEVGYYTYSQHIVKMLLQLITSLGIVMLPVMANAFAKEKYNEIADMMGNSMKFVFAVGCPMMFGISAVARNLVSWFYGNGYEPVSKLIIITSPIILIIGISNITGRQFLLPTKRQLAFTTSVIAGAVVNFIFNLVLIPRYGAIGASIATVIAEMVVSAIQIALTIKLLPYHKYLIANIKYLFYGAIMFIPCYILGFNVSGITGTLVQIIVGVMIYISLLLLTKDEVLFKCVRIILKDKKVNKIKKPL